MASDGQLLNFIINHVVFPPKLPEAVEYDAVTVQGEAEILRLVLETAEQFRAFESCDAKTAWASVSAMLKNHRKISTNAGISRDALKQVLSDLQAREAVVIHVEAQNAGMLIRRTLADQVVADAFEVSATSGDVTQTNGRLVRAFPGRSVIFPHTQLQDNHFATELADWIHTLCSEQVPLLMPTSKKAGMQVTEERDTAHPGLVTENLMSILAALGDNYNTPRIRKNTRDEVNWNNTRLPWRRSPLWLVLRVSIQLMLSAQLPPEKARLQYKNAMAFLMGKICQMAMQHGISHHQQMVINIKTARRLSKLGEQCLEFVETTIHDIVSQSRGNLDDSWSTFQNSHRKSIARLQTQATEGDISLPLHDSSAYLQRATAEDLSQDSMTKFVPPHGKVLGFGADELPQMAVAFPESDIPFLLVDFENWVLNYLDTWKDQRSPSDLVCSSLHKLMIEYVKLATPRYKANSRALSTMLLVVLELWRTLDIVSLKKYPLMKQYSPEIPVDIAKPLLLPHLHQMKILHRIEKHIQSRMEEADLTNKGILSDPHKTSFCVKYYDQSQMHQELRRKIESAASETRERKETELEENSVKHSRLIEEAERLEHSQGRDRRGRITHLTNCRKCTLENDAKKMRIQVHEWPLPNDDVLAKAAVFELRIPHGFSNWRDATWLILHELGRSVHKDGRKVEHELISYVQLKAYAARHGQRLSLGSPTKSFERSHYSSQPFPTHRDKICVSNGLTYQLLDTDARSRNVWVTGQKEVPSFKRHCISLLPAGPYANLQGFVNTTEHTPNECIAKQDWCSQGINQHEFLAFSSLRAGERLQWMNILRELASADLSLNAEAVCSLVQQAAFQVGTRDGNTVYRESHKIFEDSGFCSSLLGLLNEHLDGIKANWKEQTRMAILTFIGTRLLSLTSDSQVAFSTKCFLRTVRRVSLEWCRELTSKLPDCTTEDSSRKLKLEILKAAITCRMTFDIGERRISSLLESDEDIASVVEALIYSNDNTPVRLEDVSSDLKRNLLLSKRISRNLERPLREFILRSDVGMKQAVRQVSSITDFATKWKCVHGDQDRWMTGKTLPKPGCGNQTLHFNLLSGELLVDARPLGRLPREYTEQEIYKRVFGPRILSVSASGIPQMQYKCVRPIEGYEVHLGMVQGELVIKAILGDRRLRAIPPEKWEKDLPAQLVQEFVHWMDIPTASVHFHPLANPWETPKKEIILSYKPHGRSKMTIGTRHLIGSAGKLRLDITSILGAIETQENIITTVREDGVVEAELPRFGITFFINAVGTLESKELAAEVEVDQDIGCLIGLQSKLVVRSCATCSEVSEQSVIVPYGDIGVSALGQHRLITIYNGEAKKVTFIRYRLDKNLAKLRNPPQCLATLYKAYLHGMTSSVLPDPFTGRTGVEEALSILREQSLRSSPLLSEEESDLLNKIASMTPERTHYPPHLSVMQSLKWKPGLGQYIQNEEFYVLAMDIVSHTSRFARLSGKMQAIELASRGSSHLHKRAANRERTALNLHPGRQQRTGDSVYNARDSAADEERALRVYRVAFLIHKWPPKMKVVHDLLKKVRQWGMIEGYGEAPGLMAKSCTNMLELPLGHNWGALYDLCRSAQKGSDSFKLMFLFGNIIFQQSDKADTIDTLLAIAFSGRFTNLMPERNMYRLTAGENPSSSEVRKAARKDLRPFIASDWPGTYNYEKRKSYDDELDRQLDLVVECVRSQWPCDQPSLPNTGIHLINKRVASSAISSLFTTWNLNRKYVQHIEEVQRRLNQVNGPELNIQGPLTVLPPELRTNNDVFQTLPDLVDILCIKDAPNIKHLVPAITFARGRRLTAPTSKHEELRQILDCFRSNPNSTRRTYGRDLASSLTDLQQENAPILQESIGTDEDTLRAHRDGLRLQVDGFCQELKSVFQPKDRKEAILKNAGLSAGLTVSALLSLLSTKKFRCLKREWKQAVSNFGEAVSLLQRSERLLVAFYRDDIGGFYKESEEPGRQGWSTIEFPDWLLIEIENNLTIRRTQAAVALKMMSPDSNRNSVLQLNMGEGKSSVIIPMVTVALANGDQIARLVVLKPLLNQTQTLLAQRLGGLIDRRIYHVPFSRQTRLGNSEIESLHSLYEECKKEQGVLVALPEHILSFRLMGRELVDKANRETKRLIITERWLHSHCRDILDESDEILDSRFQLVYSMGTQQMMDGQPDRWLITQAILGIVAKQAQILSSVSSDCLEIDLRGRSYPVISFLDPKAVNKLFDLVVQQIGEGNLVGVSFDHCTEATRRLALKFIRERLITPEEFSRIKSEFGGRPVWNKLHLLRGLIAFNILLFAFQQKRWMVDYGLALNRCLMAVPYRAKGVPSLRADFGHPDVAIALTCLSYYYTGLTSEQLRLSFDLLMKESDPPGEYVRWTADFPNRDAKLRSLQGVNLDDDDLWESTLYPHLRFSKSAVDFFLSRVVFPREGKEFPRKLSASAWDLPSDNSHRPTTGFSGTNDNKFLLPMSIEQHDLPQLHGTNAMVINLLLKQENRHYIEAKDQHGKRLPVKGLLSLISKQDAPIQVLIDVGAQVLESKNEDVAKEWLQLRPDCEAAVFFDESDEVMVIDREDFTERLATSAFSNRLESCLVYLDEVHTRGIDLRLPTYARAAVTLGPRLTKDRLVQACMRMRKLGCHQSLMFFAPPEVHRGMLETSCKQQGEELDSSDVVRWCLEQTCRATDTMKPLWLSQGLEFRHRHRLCAALLEDGPESAINDSHRAHRFHTDIQEPEGRTLEEMYGAAADGKAMRPCLIDERAQQDPTAKHLLDIWNSFTPTSTGDCVLQEEQEREISHEVEQEREIQTAPPAQPEPHHVHPHLSWFVRTGSLPDSSPAVQEAFGSLDRTAAYRHLHADFGSTPDLLVTTDFVSTVRAPAGDCRNDQALRPVKWVLSNTRDSRLIIVSPHEAGSLLPDVRRSRHVRLHVYSARTSRAMRSFSSLGFYAVPAGGWSGGTDERRRLVAAQLDLFAGSLFFADYQAYRTACGFLGLLTEPVAGLPEACVSSDGFVDAVGRGLVAWPVACPFAGSPLQFLGELVGARRKGQAYLRAHVGHIVGGRMLTEAGFESV